MNNVKDSTDAAARQPPIASPFDRVVSALESAGMHPAKPAPDQWRGACPVCSHRRTLVVSAPTATRARVYCFSCHAGTDLAPELAAAVDLLILSAIGLTPADLGSSPGAVSRHHRAWLVEWLSGTARLGWPARRRASILRMLEAFASLSEQSGGPVVFATLPTLATRSGRCRKTAWTVLAILIEAGAVKRLSHTYLATVEAEDGTPRFELRPARWLLIPPIKCAPLHPTTTLVGGGIRGPALGCKDAHFTPAHARYPDAVPFALTQALQPGRALDQLLGDTLLETVRAWVVQGAGELSADDLAGLTGRHRVTTLRHLKRLEQTPTPAGRVVVCITPGGPSRGRGRATVYRLNIRALESLAQLNTPGRGQ